MEFGICMFATDYSMQAADLAVAVEDRGFDALFIPDHTHIPASRETPFIIGGELPPDYSHNLDMFLGLTAAAAVTKRIRLGTGICLVMERDPITTAKEVASLDYISGGRLDFGIGVLLGAGSNPTASRDFVYAGQSKSERRSVASPRPAATLGGSGVLRCQHRSSLPRRTPG